jgi:hypothetical protein
MGLKLDNNIAFGNATARQNIALFHVLICDAAVVVHLHFPFQAFHLAGAADPHTARLGNMQPQLKASASDVFFAFTIAPATS